MKKKIVAFFGKLKKTPEMNMSCFILCTNSVHFNLIIASAAYLNVKKMGSEATSADIKFSKKFKKYLDRMNEVMEGTCKKISNTPVN